MVEPSRKLIVEPGGDTLQKTRMALAAGTVPWTWALTAAAAPEERTCVKLLVAHLPACKGGLAL